MAQKSIQNEGLLPAVNHRFDESTTEETAINKNRMKGQWKSNELIVKLKSNKSRITVHEIQRIITQ